MAEALLITVRFHEGRYHGSGDWPPAPGRLFQALVAGAARGATLEEVDRNAFDWFERLSPPDIAAPHGQRGQAYATYVPNNDIDSELRKRETPTIASATAAIRVRKTVRPILFDSAMPVLYCWSLGEAANKQAARICELAKCLYRLGLGVDMAWAEAALVDADEAEERLSGHGGVVFRPGKRSSSVELLCPRPGSCASLTARFDGMRNRLRAGGTNRKPVTVFHQPPKPRLVKVPYNAPPRRFIFDLGGGDASAGFAPWPLEQTARLVGEVRDQIAQSLCSAAPDLSRDVERVLIGRGATDTDKPKRVQFVPIPSVGHEHVDFAVRRLAVFLPQYCPLRMDDLVWALGKVVWTDEEERVERDLREADDKRMADRFEERGRYWRSVTPLALPMRARRESVELNHAQEEGRRGNIRVAEEARATAKVREALRHAGVRASAVDIRVQRQPFHRRGVRSELFADGTRFARHALWHAAVTFSEPVKGPLILGDGRFLGLGLMLPERPRSDAVAFEITDGLAGNADPLHVAVAARRAMMARTQHHLGPKADLPTYVCGHTTDGGPVGKGDHRHVAVVADLPRRRILYVAPSLMQRGGVGWREIAQDHLMMTQALEGMNVLRAAAAGRLTLAPTLVSRSDDPLFASARTWESVTDYNVTRHRRHPLDAEALKLDVMAELQRCGWPSPKAVDVLAVRSGARGAVSGKLRLVFAAAQAGPLLVGRTAHKGGGLFVGR